MTAPVPRPRAAEPPCLPVRRKPRLPEGVRESSPPSAVGLGSTDGPVLSPDMLARVLAGLLAL